MDYAIVNDENIIENVIVIEDPAFAENFNALPLKEGQCIGDKYEPPEPPAPEPDRVDVLESAVTQLTDAIIS